MKLPKTVNRRFAVIPVAIFLANCGGSDPLDYETAIALVRDRDSDPLKTVFSAIPPYHANDIRINRGYTELIDGHVLDCKQASGVGAICVPGPAGDILTPQGTADLSVVAGRWQPEVITGMQRTGRSSAVADIRMKFEPTSLYREFEGAFDNIQYASAALALSDRKSGKMMRASFRRYDDGWHLENIQ